MPRRYRLKKRQSWIATTISVLIICVSYAQSQGWLDDPAQQLSANQPGLYTAERVSDGDTISVSMNGKTEKIRFIGVDTPETHKPNAPVQCYGPAASAFTKRMLTGQKVRLEADDLSTNRDRYDRLLRYVYRASDGTFMNRALIEQGYGFYYPYFPFTKSTEFAAAQKTAQQSSKGLWANCAPTKTDRGGYISNNQ
jgi:micrococcal nuclease